MKKKELPKHTKSGATSFIVNAIYDDNDEVPDQLVDLILNGEPPPKPYDMYMDTEMALEFDKYLNETRR